MPSTPPAFGHGVGAAAADYDDDGLIDLFVPNGFGVADQLYHNQGGGTFLDVAATVGVDSTQNSRSAIFFDYDGDGLLDLLVGADCFGEAQNCAGLSPLKLYRQISATQFVDVTAAAGLSGVLGYNEFNHIGGLAAGDLNNDSYLDLVVAGWANRAAHGSHVLLNQNGVSFSDITATSGTDTGNYQNNRWQPVIYDLTGDGFADIFQAVDFLENLLFINQGDETFVDVAAAAGVDSAFNEMGVTLGDYDGDGDFDIYVTNIHRDGKRNLLLRNDSTPAAQSYTEVSIAAGVDDTDWGWGTTFFDADLDGDVDLAVTNGHRSAPNWLTDPSRLFRNDGGTFSDISAASGFDDTYWGSALIALDYDRDGDLDLAQHPMLGAPFRLLANSQSGSNHHLVVKPRQHGPNRYAIGATVQASAGPMNMMRRISVGTSYNGQEPAEAFFGLGAETSADLTILWPTGTSSTRSGIGADQIVEVLVPPMEVGPPSPSLCSGGPVSWTVTYTGASAVTLSAGDVSLTGTDTAVGSGVSVSGSGNATRTLTVSSVTGFGRLSLTIAEGTATDASANEAPGLVAGASCVVDPGTDADGDGISDFLETTADADGDLTPNYLDTDSDADGIPDEREGSVDSDSDGVADYLDTDADGDGLPDASEGEGDGDGDLVPNYLDLDSDGDGYSDAAEATNGTDPYDPNSRPGVSPVPLVGWPLVPVLLAASLAEIRRRRRGARR